MSEIEKRQLSGDGTVGFENIIADYHPDIPIPPISHEELTTQQTAPDILNNDRISTLPAVPGTVPDTAKVVSTYDARPINAVDFTQILSSGAGPFGALTVTFNVPAGVICVLKDFSFYVSTDNQPAVDQFGQEVAMSTPATRSIQFSIGVNGIWQPNYTLLNLGQYVKRHPCYILANQNSILSFRFQSIGDGILMNSYYLVLYGQFLLTTGRSLNFEPGNIVTSSSGDIRV